MIDAYKQVLVGQYETPKATENVPDLTSDPEIRKALDKKAEENKSGENADDVEALEYGTREAAITEYFLTDHNGVRTTAILKGNTFTMHMRVKIHQDLEAPIFAFSIKNVNGLTNLSLIS